MKKLDAAGSLRASMNYVGQGSVRRREESRSSEKTVIARAPAPAAAILPQKVSERGRAGQALVEEVMLGVLDQV